MDIANVYNSIANDFSRTRYKVWHSIGKFIDNFKENTLNADIGCGNGKNMLYKENIKFKGMDISEEFVKICLARNLDVIQGNILNIPFDNNIFDNTICIAVIHHLNNVSDRINAIGELIRITKIGGHILIYVWAFEQEQNSKRKFSSCDELVPFTTLDGKTEYRYYHLYCKDELEKEINNFCDKIKIKYSGYEKGNWYCILEKI